MIYTLSTVIGVLLGVFVCKGKEIIDFCKAERKNTPSNMPELTEDEKKEKAKNEEQFQNLLNY